MNYKKLSQVKDSEVIEVKDFDELADLLNKKIMSDNSLTVKVTGEEDFEGIEADIEDFIYNVASDTGDSADVEVKVNAPIIEIKWQINMDDYES